MTQNTQTPVQGAARQSQRAPMLRPPRRFSDRVKARSQQSAFERVAAPLVVVAGLLFGVLATLWITGLSLNDPSDEQSEASAPPALLSGSTGSTERVVTSSLGEGSVRSSAGTNDEALKPPMERFGVMPPVFGDRAVLALIVEGLGHDAALDKRLLALKLPLTVAISSDVTGAGRLAAKARSAGYEVLLQVPFEPLTGPIAPNSIMSGESQAENLRRLALHLNSFEGYVGVVTQDGEVATANGAAMQPVLAALRGQGLIFIDAHRSNYSVAGPIAARMQIPTATNRWFLDTENERPLIRRELGQAEQDARSNGTSIAIGRLSEPLLGALEDWAANRDSTEVVLAPITAVVKRMRQPK